MKKLLFLFILVISLTACSKKQQVVPKEQKSSQEQVQQQDLMSQNEEVFVCLGPNSVRYHSNPDCRGLKNCSCEVACYPVQEAAERGYTPCRICYGD
jgi:hypothetical protein